MKTRILTSINDTIYIDQVVEAIKDKRPNCCIVAIDERTKNLPPLLLCYDDFQSTYYWVSLDKRESLPKEINHCSEAKVRESIEKKTHSYTLYYFNNLIEGLRTILAYLKDYQQDEKDCIQQP